MLNMQYSHRPFHLYMVSVPPTSGIAHYLSFFAFLVNRQVRLVKFVSGFDFISSLNINPNLAATGHQPNYYSWLLFWHYSRYCSVFYAVIRTNPKDCLVILLCV